MALIERLEEAPGVAQTQRGISLASFLAAVSVAILLFAAQVVIFLLLRRHPHLKYIYRSRQLGGNKDAPRTSPLPILREILHYHDERSDDEICENDGLDAFFFLRYLKTVGRIFRPILLVVMPVLMVLNYAGGRSGEVGNSAKRSNPVEQNETTIGLDVFAFGNVSAANTQRYACHAVMAVLVTLQFCRVVLEELKTYTSRRQAFLRRQDKRLVFISPLPPVLKNPDGMRKFLCHFTMGDKQITLFRDRLHDEQPAPPRSSAEAFAEYQNACMSRSDFHSAIVDFDSSIAPSMMSSVRFGENLLSNCFVSRVASTADIIWENTTYSWTKRWVLSGAVHVVLIVMVVFWAIPVASTAVLGQVDVLIRRASWLSFVQQHKFLHTAVAASAGVLPGAALALLLYLLPIILGWLAHVRGTRLHSQRAIFVQKCCFIFLFIQMVLVVSIASFFTSSVPVFLRHLRTLESATAVVNLLSHNLPTAANYFFSYLIMQAFLRSAGSILQLRRVLLFLWRRWQRQCDPQEASKQEKTGIADLACEMPIYTTFACIGLVYSIIAPLISIFVLLSFSLAWLTQRYWFRHTAELDVDHGGISYPIALHQTFVGVYVMLLCLAGLFFGVRDQSGRASCIIHGIVMICLLILVAIYQALLRSVFDEGMNNGIISDDDIKHMLLQSPEQSITISPQTKSPEKKETPELLKNIGGLFRRKTLPTSRRDASRWLR